MFLLFNDSHRNELAQSLYCEAMNLFFPDTLYPQLCPISCRSNPLISRRTLALEPCLRLLSVKPFYDSPSLVAVVALQ
jgi:hypothetical protein